MERIEWVALTVKIALVLGTMLTLVPIMVWLERRGSAIIQNRAGPNRVGPLGLFQPLADALKFIMKEDIVPAHVNKLYYTLAPAIPLIPALMTFAVIPFGGDIDIAGNAMHLQIADLNVGALYVLAISSLGVYGIIMAGWSSNNKYSLLGSLRSSAQMISYELALGLSVVGAILVFGTLNLRELVEAQAAPFFTWLPRWGVFVQPLGFITFSAAMFAETNRLPFDLPEGENEIVAGYHTEYGSMRFALFFMAEYMNMIVASAMIATLYFGGYLLLPGMHLLTGPLGAVIGKLGIVPNPVDWARALLQMCSFAIKTGFFLWVFVWIRWTIPRFRYDQVMNLGWKLMFPLALGNIALTAMLMYAKVI